MLEFVEVMLSIQKDLSAKLKFVLLGGAPFCIPTRILMKHHDTFRRNWLTFVGRLAVTCQNTACRVWLELS
jgi:hypothetical protein